MTDDVTDQATTYAGRMNNPKDKMTIRSAIRELSALLTTSSTPIVFLLYSIGTASRVEVVKLVVWSTIL